MSLAECCEIISGATPKTGVASYWDGDIDWVTPADLSDLDGPFIDETPRKITKAGLASCSATVLPVGAVLLSSRAPIGHVAIALRPMATNQGFKSLIPRAEVVDPKYLYHWLRTNKSHLQSLGNGATFKELSKAAVARIEIPVPDLGEQRRIAAILDQADLLRAQRRQALAHIDDLIQSIFLDMFGDPMTNPRGLPRRPLGEWGRVTTGNTPPRVEVDNYGLGVEWIKSDNLSSGAMYASRAAERLSPTGEEKARVVPAGSILVTCIAGSPNSIGNCALVDRPVAFNQQINALTLQSADPHFVWAQLRVGKGLIQEKSTGGMKGLVNKSAFSSVHLLDAPQEEQLRFAKLIGAVDAARHRLIVSSQVLGELQRAVRNVAFGGRI